MFGYVVADEAAKAADDEASDDESDSEASDADEEEGGEEGDDLSDTTRDERTVFTKGVKVKFTGPAEGRNANGFLNTFESRFLDRIKELEDEPSDEDFEPVRREREPDRKDDDDDDDKDD